MVKLRWLREWKDRNVGDISEAGTKSAENFVSQGYAEYVRDEPQEELINFTEHPTFPTMEFNIFHNGIFNTTPNGTLTVKEFSDLIRNDTELFQKIRKEEDKDKRNELKKKLSYVTFGGTFRKRGNNNLIKSSGLICLDFDGMSLEDVQIKKQMVINDKYTHCVFISPSGKGLKIIVKIPNVVEDLEYKSYYVSCSQYFSDKYELNEAQDESTKDISRACYLSYDPEVFYKEFSDVFKDKKIIPIHQQDKKEGKESRSETEFGEVMKLLKKYGEDKDKIFNKMKAFAKWSEQGEAYQEHTWKKAVDKFKEENEKNGEKKERLENTKQINRYVDQENQIIIEQVLDREKGSLLAIYNHKEKKVEYVKEYYYKGFYYVPKEGEEIEKGAVLLPSQAEEYNEDELDEEIKNFILKWLDVPEEVLKFGIWNTKRSWVYDLFHNLNYLRALGDTGVGKSRYLNTFGNIHYTPIFTNGNTTSAPLFRIIDKWRGTLVMDEADLKKSDESDDIIKIINQGFEKGNFVMRCDQNDANKINFFDPYCPKILATRRTFTDKATESRCITHVMIPTENKEIPVNLNNDFYEESLKIRNKLLMWRFKNFFEIDLNKKYDLGDLEPRVKQIVSSYVVLFSKNEKQMEEFKEYINQYQGDLIEERQNTFEGAIVGIIHQLLKNGYSNITASKIIEFGQLENERGKQMQPRALTSYLKSLGFKKSEVEKIDGKAQRCIPINQKHIEKLFERYGYEVTKVTVVTETSENNNNNNNESNIEILKVGTPLRNNRNDSNLRNPDYKGEVTKNNCEQCSKPTENEINGIFICEDCAKDIVEEFK